MYCRYLYSSIEFRVRKYVAWLSCRILRVGESTRAGAIEEEFRQNVQ